MKTKERKPSITKSDIKALKRILKKNLLLVWDEERKSESSVNSYEIIMNGPFAEITLLKDGQCPHCLMVNESGGECECPGSVKDMEDWG